MTHTRTLLDSRKAFSETLCELAEKDDRILGVSGDMSYIVAEFKSRFPEKFINVGVAEQNMVGMACGLAFSGFIPFVTTMSPFLSLRAAEQIRTDGCYAGANVKIVGTGGGTCYGTLGNTHMGLEDVAVTSSFANMVVLAPADAFEIKQAVKAAAGYVGPVYMRISRGAAPVVYGEGRCELDFTIGKADILREGSDVALIASGCFVVSHALDAADMLAEAGVSAAVVNVSTLKPIDRETVVWAARKAGRIVTVEDHQVRNGLGSAVCQAVASEAPVPVKCLGVPDVYTPIADHEELLHRYSLDAAGIAAAARCLVEGKQ